MKNRPKLFSWLLAALVAPLCLGLTACSWVMPDDPYLQAKSVPPLKVPEPLDSPSPDPNLVVPEGEIADKPIKGGHTPPTEALSKPSE